VNYCCGSESKGSKYLAGSESKNPNKNTDSDTDVDSDQDNVFNKNKEQTSDKRKNILGFHLDFAKIFANMY
jgi:hypothetical protein